VCHRLFAINVLLHDTVLVDANGRQHIECALVARIDTVEHQAHDNLLPRWAAFVPELRLLQADDIAYVLHHPVQRARRKRLVLVVICDGNQQLRMSVVHRRAKIVPIFEGEVVGIAGRGRVSQMCKLFTAALQVVPIFGLHCILDCRWDWVVCTQHCTLNKLDLARRVPLQASHLCSWPTGRLSFPPCLSTARLAPLVWTRRARRLSVAWVFECGGAVPTVVVLIVGLHMAVVRANVRLLETIARRLVHAWGVASTHRVVKGALELTVGVGM